MTEFISRNHGHECHEIIIKTTDHEHYRASEEFARRLIDHAKPMTNADRIRAMTDEELAHEFYEVSRCDNGCQGCERCYFGRSKFCNDEEDMLEWLSQPAEEE